MKVTCENISRHLKVTVAGELDHHAARDAVQRIGYAIETAIPKSCEIDMKGLTFMDSSGIAVVLNTYKKMKSFNGTTTVTNTPVYAKKVLSAAGVDRIIPIE